jgi:outer membrane protein
MITLLFTCSCSTTGSLDEEYFAGVYQMNAVGQEEYSFTHENSPQVGEIGSDDIPPLLADNAPPAVSKTIVEQYPGAEIREVEPESWEGLSVWEVELTTIEGDDFEIILSESGDIFDISEALPLIGGELALGFGTFWEKSPYKGVGSEVDPVPIISYRNGPLQIEGTEFSYSLLHDDGFSFGLLGEIGIGDGFEEDDSDYLEGMDEPDMTTLHGGLFCTYETPYVDFEFKFLNELQNEHSGQQLEFSIGREWEFGDFEIEPSVSVKYQSSDWTDYYYGVSRTESRPGRSYYEPGSALNISGELMIQYEVSPDISLIWMLECENLDSCIRRSPIIERDLIFEVFFGIMYSF